jgi:hypothetical protein
LAVLAARERRLEIPALEASVHQLVAAAWSRKLELQAVAVLPAAGWRPALAELVVLAARAILAAERRIAASRKGLYFAGCCLLEA